MNLFPPHAETIEGLAADLRAGRRGCVEILDACLARIDVRESAVRAWVVIDREGARAQARGLDAERAAGRWRGPLHGIPVGIKDIIDVAGLPTAGGVPSGAGRVATEDAEVVGRLRAAGAVILGKTVTTPHAWIDPPPTRNPWDLGRTPGGSSSGSAAAVGGGTIPAALGSQTGGSITRPASYCGAAGLKPTFGRLSLRGILPLAPSLDHVGPIARTVGDLAILWSVLSGSDSIAPSPGVEAAAPPRLGRLRGLFDDRAEPVMRDAFDRALGVLAAAGAVVTEPAPPAAFGAVLAQHRTILAAEAAAWHEARLAEHAGDYPPRMRELLAEGLALPAAAYVRARWHQAELSRAMAGLFASADALIVPATPGPPPDPSTTGDPAFNAPWSYTGLPVVSSPMARSPEGLPLAWQLVGPPGGEERLLAVARWCEEIAGKFGQNLK